MPVASGDLTPAQLAELHRLLLHAQEQSGLTFSVYLGAWKDGREGAEAMLSRLPDPDRSVLVAVDPQGRTLEIVTGRLARIPLDDHACGLAVLSMTSSFVADDLMGGLRDGLGVLADHGRRMRVFHVDQV
ncbi:MAG: DUF5130 domain-containing protein [Actinomycetales bacterium]|nr:DUF5130 domain-containing protein [Actinomycetales bacterium]